MKPGSEDMPLRVAIVGAGPAGFYAADHLFKQKDLNVEIDMFDRLPTPFGLVRHGVAPDHQKIKLVTRVFEKVAANHGFRFFGNVELGKDISVDELREHYHQIVYTVGAQSDRRLNIPGEDLAGSHAATEFVAWYNGHPDYVDRQFDLSQTHVAIVGVGNVAVDVARILCRTPEELAETDIADHALEALRESKVRDVQMIGRRGPAQAAFSVPEVRELNRLPGAVCRTLADEAELDELSAAHLKANPDRVMQQKVDLLEQYAGNEPEPDKKTLTIRFLVSPTELIGDERGRVKAMRLVRNELYAADDGSLRPQPTDETIEIPVGLVFRSVGYHGVPIPGVPFHERWGVIHNECGRVIDSDTQQPIVGEYTAGWIKRGPTGLIGTNKADAIETVQCMIEDVQAGRVLSPAKPSSEHVAQLIDERQPQHFTYEQWQQVDAHEMSLGERQGRPRVKLTKLDEMLEAIKT